MLLKTQKVILIVSILLFVASLFCPALEDLDIIDKPEVMPGYLVLISGWFAITFLHPAWLANITWLVGNILFLKKKYQAFFILSIASTLLALDSYIYPSKRFIGFWQWNVAVTLPLVAALIGKITNKIQKQYNSKLNQILK